MVGTLSPKRDSDIPWQMMYRNRSFQFLIYSLLEAVLPVVHMDEQQFTHGMSCCTLRRHCYRLRSYLTKVGNRKT